MATPMPDSVKHRMTHRNLPQLFLKARDCLMAHFRPILNHCGLTEQQWRILRALDSHTQLEPREICELCQIHSSSMAGVLARMEELGLVQRSRMPQDQRRVEVRLGQKGDALMHQLAPLIEQQYKNIEDALGQQVFDDLFNALENFVAADATPVLRIALPPVAIPSTTAPD